MSRSFRSFLSLLDSCGLFGYRSFGGFLRLFSPSSSSFSAASSVFFFSFFFSDPFAFLAIRLAISSASSTNPRSKRGSAWQTIRLHHTHLRPSPSYFVLPTNYEIQSTNTSYGVSTKYRTDCIGRDGVPLPPTGTCYLPPKTSSKASLPSFPNSLDAGPRFRPKETKERKRVPVPPTPFPPPPVISVALRLPFLSFVCFVSLCRPLLFVGFFHFSSSSFLLRRFASASSFVFLLPSIPRPSLVSLPPFSRLPRPQGASGLPARRRLGVGLLSCSCSLFRRPCCLSLSTRSANGFACCLKQPQINSVETPFVSNIRCSRYHPDCLSHLHSPLLRPLVHSLRPPHPIYDRRYACSACASHHRDETERVPRHAKNKKTQRPDRAYDLLLAWPSLAHICLSRRLP